MMIRVMSLLALIVFSNVSLAGTPPFQGCTTSGCAGKLDSVYLHPNGSVRVPPMGGNSDDLGCTLASNTYLTLKREHISFNEIYSMMLTAHASSKDIFLRTVIDSPDCEIWYAVIY